MALGLTLAIILILEVLSLGGVALLLYAFRRLALFDPARIGDLLALRLLRDYDARDLRTLSEETVRTYARTQYIELATEIGLPVRVVDSIAGRVWWRIAQAQGLDEESGEEEFSFYD